MLDTTKIAQEVDRIGAQWKPDVDNLECARALMRAIGEWFVGLALDETIAELDYADLLDQGMQDLAAFLGENRKDR